MTYIQDNATLKALIQRAQDEFTKNKYLNAQAPYANILIEHWGMLDDIDKKNVCILCLNMTMNLKGADSKSNELSNVKRIIMMPEYSKVKDELKKHIEAMPVKNGNQVVQRYIQSMLWEIDLEHYSFDKINDKTSFTLRGWMLRDVFQFQRENINMTQWLSKRLLITAKKNSVEENINALLNIQLEQLNTVELARYWGTLNVVFNEHSNDLSLEQVLTINTKIGQYLDGQNDPEILESYNGIPDTFLPIVPVDDIYVQRYACNRFFIDRQNSYYFGHTSAFYIPTILFENNRFFQEKTPEQRHSWNVSILRSVYNRLPTVVDTFYFDQGSMGFKVLLTLLKLLGVMDDRLSNYNSQILPQLYKIGKCLHLDVEPIIQGLVHQASRPKMLAIVNEVFAPFMKPFVEKINAYNGILYNENLELNSGHFALNYTTGMLEAVTSDRRKIHVERLLPVYEVAIKDMGSDLGYTDEEVALLF